MQEQEIILLVEDDHDTRVTYRHTLEERGYFVYSAANGKDALKLLSIIKRPHLIILDLSMPIMNGEDFLKIKALEKEIRDIPVLVVTANKKLPGIIKNLPQLKKPIDIEKFIEKVLECMRSNAASKC